jgi:hypothetical protein
MLLPALPPELNEYADAWDAASASSSATIAHSFMVLALTRNDCFPLRVRQAYARLREDATLEKAPA